MRALTSHLDLTSGTHTVRDVRAVVLDLADVWDSTVSRVDLALLVDEMSAELVADADDGAALVLDVVQVDRVLFVALTTLCAPPAGRAGRADWGCLAAVLAGRWGDDWIEVGRRAWFELRPPPVEVVALSRDDVAPDVAQGVQLATYVAQLARGLPDAHRVRG